MQLLARFVDKILFATLFIASLQIPVLFDHYRQYLAGFYEATRQQVAQLDALAAQYGFASTDSLITHLSENSDPIVRQDAQAKAQLLRTLTDTEKGLAILQHGNYFQRVGYIFSPRRSATLSQVLENFTPALPLTINSVIYSLLLALLLNSLLLAPFWGCKTAYAWHKQRKQRLRIS